MNFLFHMLLSGEDDQLMVGNFMGDFVKGPLRGRFPPRIRQGVRLHRMIDSYADKNPHFCASKQRLSQEYGLYRGAMVDIFYDYFLVNSWDEWCDEPFEKYLVRTRFVIDTHLESVPEKMHRLVPTIFGDLLPSYRTVEGIGSALGRLSRRITRANPLSGGGMELIKHHDALHRDFNAFTPEIFRFVSETIEAGIVLDG